MTPTVKTTDTISCVSVPTDAISALYGRLKVKNKMFCKQFDAQMENTEHLCCVPSIVKPNNCISKKDSALPEEELGLNPLAVEAMDMNRKSVIR